MKKNFCLLITAVLVFACNWESLRAVPTAEVLLPPSTNNLNINTLNPGSYLYVHAPSGLVLRKTPSKNGVKIANVPCNGLPLTVLEMPDPANRYVAEKIGDFEVSGGWVKVKTVEGWEGYVFEGYLFRYPPALEEPESEDSYLEWFYRTVSPRKGKREPLPAKPGMVEGYKQAFEDGAVFQFEFYEGGVTHYFYLPENKMTMQEALVVFRPIWFRGKTNGAYDAGTETLTIVEVDGYAQMTIQSKNGQLVLQFSSAD